MAFRAECFGWLLTATGLVAAGLVLEGPELWREIVAIGSHWRFKRKFHFSLPEEHPPNWAKLLAFAGWIFIVIGVAGEFVADRFVSEADGYVQTFDEILLADAQSRIAFANERASAAYERAAQTEKEASEAKERTAALEKDAAELQLENTRLLELVQPRTLTIEQQKAVGEALKQYAGKFVIIRASLSDQEAVQLGQSILNSLRGGGVKAFSFFAVSGLANPPIGVRAIGPDEELVDAINNVLRDRGNLALSPATWKPIEEGFVSKPNLPRPTDADIWVGAKPLPSQDKYQIQQMTKHR